MWIGFAEGELAAMIQPNSIEPRNAGETKIPRRDWILLPLLGLVTMCVLLVSAESVARRQFATIEPGSGECKVRNGPSIITRRIPGCVYSEKIAEGEPVEYRFNRSGYRSDVDFGPKPPSTYRIVMVGTCFAMGLNVPQERTSAALLPMELSQLTGRRVELFNQGIEDSSVVPQAANVSLRLDDALAARPDLIVWVLSSWDITGVSPPVAAQSEADPGIAGRIRSSASKAFASQTIPDAVHAIMRPVHARLGPIHFVFMLQHFLYESPSQRVKAGLMDEDGAGSLLAEPNEVWRERLLQFDKYDADIQMRARAAGVPVAVVLMPDGVQAALISRGEWKEGYDPYKLDEELGAIVARNGGTWISVTHDYRKIPNSERGYFPVDGHPNADGNAIFAKLLADELTSGSVPALRAAALPPAALKHGN